MKSNKFKIGQTVLYRPGNHRQHGPRGAYRVISCFLNREDGGIEYWVRNLNERHERAAKESELTRNESPGSEERQMGIPLESIAVGKCFVTDIGQVRRVLEVEDGKVKYESRGKTAHGRSWGDATTVPDGKFARDVNREVPSDYDPDSADKTIPIDQLNASNDE